MSTTSSDGAHYYSLEGAGGNASLEPQLTVVCADGSPISSFLPRFNVTATSRSTVIKATLRLTARATLFPYTTLFRSTGSGWNESTVNWTNAPSSGPLLNSLGAVASGSTYT